MSSHNSPFWLFCMLRCITRLHCGSADFMFLLYHEVGVKFSFCSFLRHMHASMLFPGLHIWKASIARNRLNVAADRTTYLQAVETELTWHFCLAILCQVEMKGTYFTLHVLIHDPHPLSLTARSPPSVPPVYNESLKHPRVRITGVAKRERKKVGCDKLLKCNELVCDLQFLRFLHIITEAVQKWCNHWSRTKTGPIYVSGSIPQLKLQDPQFFSAWKFHQHIRMLHTGPMLQS